MIGSGGNIGRPKTGPHDPALSKEAAATPAKAPSAPAKTAPSAPARASGAPAPLTSPPKVSDKFEKAARAAHELGSASPPAARESTAADLAKLSRDNPAAAIRICDGFVAQAKSTLCDIERELAAARGILDQLAAEGFRREAVDKAAHDLRARRDRLAGLKRMQQSCLRRVALLQQVAGYLASPALEDEIDALLRRHAKLRTDWGRRYGALSLGELLFSAEEDAPEHLREVVQTDVRAGTHGAETAELLGEISPQRIIAELIARTLDGSSREASPKYPLAVRGDLGRAVRGYSLLLQLFDSSAATDPFAKH